MKPSNSSVLTSQYFCFRIIHVSSVVHYYAKLNINELLLLDLNARNDVFDADSQYYLSKFCQVSDINTGKM